MNFRPRNAAWRGWRSIFGGVIARIVWFFPGATKKRSVTTCMERFGRGFGVENRDRRPKGGRIFFSCFCWLGWIVKHIVYGWASRCTSSQDFCWLIVFLGFDKAPFLATMLMVCFVWSITFMKGQPTLEKKIPRFMVIRRTGPRKRWHVVTLPVPKVIGSYGSCRAKVAAWLFGGGMRLGSQLYDPEFVVVVVCTCYPPWNQKKLAPENGWLEDDLFLLGWLIFRIFLLLVSVV